MVALAGATVAQETPGPTGAPTDNAYDVLGKTLQPIVHVFAPDANGNPVSRGLVLDAHLTQATRLPQEMLNQPVHVALMTPDAVLAQAPIAGDTLTVCRDGDELWAAPGAKIKAILDQLDALARSEGKTDRARRDAARALGPLELPIPAKELVFLPILFQAADAGAEAVNGVPCRVLDVGLMPQLEKALHAQGWRGRVWIGPGYAIKQITLAGPAVTVTLVIDGLEFPTELPEATFQPAGKDVLKLSPSQFLDLVSHAGQE